MPFAAALSVVLLAMTAIVLFIYRRQGGEAESMVPGDNMKKYSAI